MKYIDKKKSELIRLGWDRLDEETKTKLKNLGIRDLHHTPGTLINPRGYIPGAVGTFGTVWGKLQMTGDMAEKNLGFRPKEGAIGVLLSRRKYVDDNGKVKNGIFAISLMRRYVTHTEKMKASWDRMRVLGKMASKYKSEIIHPIWEPLVTNKSRKPWSGYHYFMSLNSFALGSSLNWSKLVISKGELSSPQKVCPSCYRPIEKQIEIILPLTINRQPLTINQVGIGIFDIITGDFFHISPEQLAAQLEQRFKSCGIKLSMLRRGGLVSKLEPLNLLWELEKARKHYCPSKRHGFSRIHSRFYIYTYYRRQRLEVRSQKLETGRGLTSSGEKSRLSSIGVDESVEEIRDKNAVTHKFQYSASICSRIKVCKGRRKEKGGMPIIIEVRGQ